MNRKFSKLISLLLISTLLLAVLFVMSACGDSNSVSEIYIKKADLPRTEYVEGQELDLSKGKLTAVINGEETKLPLTDENVSVTGYDKDVTGKQSVTVEYAGFTTSFNVTVAERTVAENFETKYFVGSEFNPNKGKIRITLDDAKTVYVNMNDKLVNLVSFDSSVAGTSTVTLLYSDGINAYYCQFNVTVYEQSNIEFTAPAAKYNEYVSHYQGLPIVEGGYFKVTSSDGTLTMNVPVTESMVEGFDVSKATIENREAPLEQKLTVNYLGNAFYYNVYITYSGVSAINYYTENVLSKIDWVKAEADGFSEEETTAALNAITEYYSLGATDKALISDETKELVAKAGAVALNNVFFDEIATYKNSFTFDLQGNLYFIKTSYTKTYDDVQRLNDPKEKINVYAELLRQIVVDFGDVSLTEEAKLSDFIVVYSAEKEETLKGMLNHFVDVFALLKDIPDVWSKETLESYGGNILTAAMQINTAGYYAAGYGSTYTSILAGWRDNSDLFDIIYTYFLYVYENGKEFMQNYMWGKMPMPGLLESWYAGLKTCTEYSYYYKIYESSNYRYIDMTPYMYTYFRTLDIVDQIKASGDQFIIDIYNTYNGDNMNQKYMYTYSYGYLDNVQAMIDSEAFHTLWKAYYEVLKYYNGKTISATTHKAEIMAMYKAFEALTPTELLGFLSSFNLGYTGGKGASPMLGYVINPDDGKPSVYNYFSLILANYFGAYLTEDNQTLFNEILSAVETYALIGYKDGALEEFKTKMGALNAKITLLEGAEKANYIEYLETLYVKYYKIYQAVSNQQTYELSEQEQAIVSEFLTTAEQFFVVYSNIYNLIQNGYTVADDAYPILYALYARVSELRDSLIAGGNDTTLLVMATKEYDLLETKYSLDRLYYVIDSVVTSMLSSQSAIVSKDGKAVYVTYWDLYADNELLLHFGL